MPAAPTITVTDNEDGTATVAVSGSDVGTTNTAYYAPVNYPTLDGSNWTSGGTSSGDGNIAVTPVPTRHSGGVYLWHVTSDDGSVAISNVVQQRVSTSAQSVYEQILEAVHAQIGSLSLTGVDSNNVVLQTAPDTITGRMVIVAPFGPERMLTGRRQRTNASDDIVYPVIVAHVDAANQDQTEVKRDRWLKWRQDISRTFRSQPHLVGVNEVYDCTITYRAPVDDTAWFKANQCVGALVLNFTCREGRTL